MKNRKSRNIFIGVLVLILLFVGTGYALLNSNLKIKSYSKIVNSLNVKLTDVQLLEKSDNSISTSYEIQNNELGIVFDTVFVKPGDYVVYNITIQNNDSSAIEITNISKNLIDGSSNYDISYDLENNSYIPSNSSLSFNVTLSYSSSSTSINDVSKMGLSIIVTQTDSSSGGNLNDELSSDVNYSGYYADTNNDGNPDGIIFVDLMASSYSSGGYWKDSDGNYSYTTITESKSYKLSNNSITNSEFPLDNKPIISANSSNGTKRFYVVALKDLGNYYWDYDSVYDISIQATENSSSSQIEIGTGYRNTGLLINSNLKNNSNNVWANLDSYYNDGWFVPSRAEISAFGDFLETKYYFVRNNLSNYGLQSEPYLTSSYQESGNQCFVGSFSYWYIIWRNTNTQLPVRLITMM